MAYTFQGLDWMELVECWEITYSEGETISRQVVVNGERFDLVFTEKDAVLLEKIKMHLNDNLALDEEGEFVLNKQVREELVDFTMKLARLSGGESRIYKWIANQKSDWHLIRWVCRNLDFFWV